MYAIRTRNGGVYLKLQSNGGDTTVMQVKLDTFYSKVPHT